MISIVIGWSLNENRGRINAETLDQCSLDASQKLSPESTEEDLFEFPLCSSVSSVSSVVEA
jgi:hypothetical protein